LIKVKNNDEVWLLSSVASAWNKVLEDAQAGSLNTERDLVSSFYHWLRPHVDTRNNSDENGLGKLRVFTEVEIWSPHDRNDESATRKIDFALVRIDKSPDSRATEIIAQFEFKYKVLYERSTVEPEIRSDIRRLGDGNEGWEIVKPDDEEEQLPRHSAKTEFSFFGLVVDDWATHIAGSSKNPNNHGILHPNGTMRYSTPTKDNPLPTIANQKKWLRYFEMHGPYSDELDDKDWQKWGVYEIDRIGAPKRIH
jgi:hypothetical protein